MAGLPEGLLIRRDGMGVARSVRIPTEAAASLEGIAASVPETPREAAEQFLRAAGDLFQIEDAGLAGLTAEGTPGTGDGMQLSFKEEKNTAGAATVAYDQTVNGLPVWGSGVTVQVARNGMRVLSSQNQLDYDLDLDELVQPESVAIEIDASRLARLLGFGEPPEGLRINAVRPLIYRYEAAGRLDATLGDPVAGALQGRPPSLPLPPVPPSIVEGRHYVAAEVLFTLPMDGVSKSLNWRAFIDTRTGAVLYLRALIASLRGCVFEHDPMLPDGTWASVDSSDIELNAQRAFVDLAGLNSGSNPQHLKGNYVELREMSSPSVPAPTVSPPGDFVYEARTREFTAVNAYHHCDRLFRLMEEMGFDVPDYFNGTTFPVPVDHYALGNKVNAQAPGNQFGNGSGGFLFGLAREGQPIGIATTARVALHEFGHALLWDHVNHPNFGFAHSAGDSLACILHDPGPGALSRFDTFPFANASAGLERRHDRRVEQGWAWGGRHDDTQYESEQVLSTTLFRLYRVAGGDSVYAATREAAARYVAFLIFKAIGMLSFTTRDPQVFVDALMDADLTTDRFEGRIGGTLVKVLRWTFEQQGLYQRDGAPHPVVSKGRPPQVDVFVDDDRDGEYLPYLADAGQSRGIWNRHSADGGVADQAPQPGQDNFLYVRVRNRGWDRADSVGLRIYRREGGAEAWPGNWKDVTSSGISIGAISAGGDVLWGPLKWHPAAADGAVLVVVSAPGDESLASQLPSGAMPSLFAPLDNNIGHRRWGVVPVA